MTMRIALFFADGRALFLGMALVAASVILRGCRDRRLRRPAAIGWMVGIVTAGLSAAPMPGWLCGSWSATMVFSAVAMSRWMAGRPWLLRAGQVAAVATCLTAVLMEWPWRRLPTVSPVASRRLVVIGDSLSAGTGQGETTWPKVLSVRPGLEVVDLSRPGETVDSALAQAARIPPGAGLVLLEIGGNDLLGPTTASGFEIGLERLIQSAAGPGRVLVMFELPLSPWGHRFGRAQRRLSVEHGVALIPKRVLADVLGSPGGVLDGLHLSDQGHRRMADWVWRCLGPALSPP